MPHHLTKAQQERVEKAAAIAEAQLEAAEAILHRRNPQAHVSAEMLGVSKAVSLSYVAQEINDVHRRKAQHGRLLP